MMVVTVGVAAFFVFRGVTRELEMASLQADRAAWVEASACPSPKCAAA